MRKKLEASELLAGLTATCSKCWGEATLYPGGLFCPNCSPPGMEDFVRSFIKTNGGYQRIPENLKIQGKEN